MDPAINFLSRGPLSADEVFRISAPASPRTVRHRLSGDPRVVKIGAARNTMYALRRVPERSPHGVFEVWETDSGGDSSMLGRLHALAGHDHWWFEACDGLHPSSFAGSVNGIFEGLPWFMDFVYPQGYLGRNFVRHVAPELDAPSDLRRWGEGVALQSAVLFGGDLPGNLTLRQDGSVPRGTPNVVAPHDVPSQMTRLADASVDGGFPGSSAAGEQPKITFRIAGGSALPGVEDRIAKFSPVVGTPASERQADLLICEHLANRVLSGAGVAVADTEIVEAGGRVFLSSRRFDRHGESGRSGLIPISAPAWFLGTPQDTWSAAADTLVGAGLLFPEDAVLARRLQAFGYGIGNSDMHLGNLSIGGSLRDGWALAPVYDMCPMGYAPGPDGPRPEKRVVLDRSRLDPQTAGLCREFWESVAEDRRVSGGFRQIAGEHALHLSAVHSPTYRLR